MRLHLVRRLLATALARAVGSASVETVRAALAGEKNIIDAVVDGERHLTTVDILKEESALMKLIRDGRGCVAPVAAGKYEFKNPLFQNDTKDVSEQRAAVLHVLQSQDWVVGVVGRAGTGKTTLLKEVAEGVRGVGRNLVICAPTAEAARGVLRAEGFETANTVQHLLTDERNHSQLCDSVLWVDEAGNEDVEMTEQLVQRQSCVHFDAEILALSPLGKLLVKTKLRRGYPVPERLE